MGDYGNTVDLATVDLADAIAALRQALIDAHFEGADSRVRFKIEPVDLTIHAGVTSTGKGAAGVKWHIISIGGERSRESEASQTLRLRLTPIFYDDEGNELPEDEQLVRDRLDAKSDDPEEHPSHDRA